MREITAERFERLERQVRRLRGLVLVMAVGFAGVMAMGATSKPDELTLRKLTIVDAEGKQRITASTLPDGTARFAHRDPDGKDRIVTGTSPEGEAAVLHFDQEGEPRIAAGTLSDGVAEVRYMDREGNRRISVQTESNVSGSGTASALRRLGSPRGRDFAAAAHRVDPLP